MTDSKDTRANTENKNSVEDQDWKSKFNDMVQSCQNELKRTTQIGMKMLSASQSNAQLHEKYEELGRLAMSALENNEIEWKGVQVEELTEKIKQLRKTLEGLEKEVSDIKKN